MTIAIILAGGTGSRIKSDIPKQFVELSGQMMIMHALAPFGESNLVDNIQIVANESWREKIEDAIFEDPESVVAEKFLGFSDPGENRQLSIYNAMRDLKKMLDCARENDCSAKIGNIHIIESVIIHDAARPFVTVENIDECISALDVHDGAMPVLPMKDTVYFSRTGKRVDELMNRSCIYAGQAPEAFRFDKYLAANEDLLPDQILMIKGSTEPAIMAGMDVAMIPGDQRHFKVTTDEDLERAREILG
ncbi:IspD/TarI family cytidylyltransferase [Butyrivibrio fibrisolvens]|uniref:IspD/TarI family cytidylyltransferase n=1 Tax=Butyrivibrio fibrisolvens TaxID=831 RepID=UPI0003B3B3C2|nr:IspD/TarI family cytidylyltransferase [Butyrivibrio fibrisolvens]